MGQNGIFTLTQGVEIQKPEGTRYDDLAKEEQDAWDLDENGIDYRIDTIKVDILNICKQWSVCTFKSLLSQDSVKFYLKQYKILSLFRNL